MAKGSPPPWLTKANDPPQDNMPSDSGTSSSPTANSAAGPKSGPPNSKKGKGSDAMQGAIARRMSTLAGPSGGIKG